MRHLLLIVLFGSLVLSGCASSMSGGAYERRQARTMQEVHAGTVESVRTVMIEGTKSGVGAAAGGIAGSAIGHGGSSRSDIGRTVGGVAGAVVGGVAGAAAEEGLTRQKGYEITVRLEGGRLVAITQAADDEFRVGDRVHVISGPGAARVAHY